MEFTQKTVNLRTHQKLKMSLTLSKLNDFPHNSGITHDIGWDEKSSCEGKYIIFAIKNSNLLYPMSSSVSNIYEELELYTLFKTTKTTSSTPPRLSFEMVNAEHLILLHSKIKKDFVQQ